MYGHILFRVDVKPSSSIRLFVIMRNHGGENLDEPCRNLQNVKDKHPDQPAKKMCAASGFTYCICSTAVVGDNSFSEMCVYARRVLHCCRVHYVINVLNF
jgi:hypothetical protein